MGGDIEAILETGSAAAVEIAASALAERGGTPGKCANCGTSLLGPYCAVCGQERDTHRRSVYALIHDLVVDIASFDSRVLRTARALIFEPGELPASFREGRTRSYVPALRLYFFVSLIFFLVLGATGIAIIQFNVVATPLKIVRDANGNAFTPNPSVEVSVSDDGDAKVVPRLIPIAKERANRPGGVYSFSWKPRFFERIGSGRAQLPAAARAQLARNEMGITIGGGKSKADPKNPEEQAVLAWFKTHVFGGMQRLVADPAAMNGPMTTWIPRILFLLLPLYAILLAVFYWRKRKDFYFVDHLIFSFGVHTFTFVVLMVDLALAQFLDGDIVALFTMAAIGVYIFIAMKRFYRQGWFWTTVKWATVSFIYCFFFLTPALATAIVLSFLDV
jgi:hypothetical protein